MDVFLYPRLIYSFPVYQKVLDFAYANGEKLLIEVADNNYSFIGGIKEYTIYERTAIVKWRLDEIETVQVDDVDSFVLRMSGMIAAEDRGEILARFKKRGFQPKMDLNIGGYVGYVMERVEE